MLMVKNAMPGSFRLFVAISLALTFTSCYVTTQGVRQIKLLSSRQDIDDVIADQSTDPKTREKLAFTKKVLAFAEKEGFEVGDAYSKFVKLGGRSVTYLVQASKPEEFKLKTWWFPIVGSVPYLGFFEVADRDHYAFELEEDGYEVHRNGAQAFSSLGWYSDPVYSSMLSDHDGDLAHLYFHELTHKTAWIKGSVEFNENFAEFIAEETTARFFLELGKPEEIERLKVRKIDLEAFKLWLKNLKASLTASYELSKSKDTDYWISQKKAIIDDAVSNKPKFVASDFIGSRPWTATRVLGASLYSPDTARFERAFKCSGIVRVGDFARFVKDNLKHSDKPEDQLTRLCSKIDSTKTDSTMK
jgi:predicted aminopeptidase